MAKIAIYAGSFDPVTYGHIDLIKRAKEIFDEVVVGVANKRSKKYLFSVEKRLQMLKEATQGMKGVRVEAFNGLAVNFAKKNKSRVLIRGLRMVSDFEYEFQMALTNRRLAEDVETVFLMPSEKYTFLSSSLIKEAASLDADISSFVPDFVAKELKKAVK